MKKKRIVTNGLSDLVEVFVRVIPLLLSASAFLVAVAIMAVMTVTGEHSRTGVMFIWLLIGSSVLALCFIVGVGVFVVRYEIAKSVEYRKARRNGTRVYDNNEYIGDLEDM